MKKMSIKDSELIIECFLDNIKRGLKKQPARVEFFELRLDEPHYELLNCAYIQTNNLKEGILYEAITNRIIYLKSEKGGMPILTDLSKSVFRNFPKKVFDKMFWVCGNQKDALLTEEDFRESFSLIKPINKEHGGL